MTTKRTNCKVSIKCQFHRPSSSDYESGEDNDIMTIRRILINRLGGLEMDGIHHKDYDDLKILLLKINRITLYSNVKHNYTDLKLSAIVS
ncbi:Hypothetical protein CINCED_3A015941 [Cinara cedri]|uniref:Uncharacterized protein n=1 Tax=Cinara cedri TaxID=506608 RepID=A0A5E4MT80_9HEMI|nr:Hypothetical protein CINCED_3A015941 [Cinara cedri]